MAKIDLKKLKNLTPEERIKVLKELQAKLKKARKDEEEDLEAAVELLQEATEEANVLERIEKPKVKEVKLEELFKREENLEEKAQQEQAQKEEKGLFTGAQVEQYKSPVQDEPQPFYQDEKKQEMYERETGEGINQFYKKEEKKKKNIFEEEDVVKDKKA